MTRVVQIKLQPTKPVEPAAITPRGLFRIVYRQAAQSGVSNERLSWLEGVLTVAALNRTYPGTTHWLIPATREDVTIGSILKPTHEWN